MDFIFGEDIYAALVKMPSSDKQALARELFEQQNKAIKLLAEHVKSINANPGYGRSSCFGTDFPIHFWTDFLVKSRPCIDYAERRDQEVDKLIDMGVSFIETYRNVLNEIPPLSSLWDIGDRNVLVSNGKIAAIIDQDTILFGDRLWAFAAKKICNKARGGKANDFVAEWGSIERDLDNKNGGHTIHFDERLFMYELSATSFMLNVTAGRTDAENEDSGLSFEAFLFIYKQLL